MSPASALSYLLKPNAVLSSPPSSVIEQAFKSGNVTPDNLARKVLLPLREVEMWLDHLGMVSDNRKRGAAKAAATKKSKLSGRKNEDKIVRCGVCCVMYEEETDEVEKWIACDLCTTWFHWNCVNVTIEPDSFLCTLCG